jgi:hypothetical protein
MASKRQCDAKRKARVHAMQLSRGMFWRMQCVFSYSMTKIRPYGNLQPKAPLTGNNLTGLEEENLGRLWTGYTLLQ